MTMIMYIKIVDDKSKRSDFIIDGLCDIIDGTILVLSLGHILVGLRLWWFDKVNERNNKTKGD